MRGRKLTELELGDWKLVESVHGWRIVDPERHEPDDPDEWMPDYKPRGDTAERCPLGRIPPRKEP